jgi:glycogen operon protein
MADRLLGSPGIYGRREREAEESINFVACHDGFTLNDVVTYNCKHNEENGEDNRDGHEDNRSWNCGFDGQTDDPEIEKLRNRQVKNFFTASILSVGVPMFAMGDEVRRSQRGNNNAYCQDNDISWFDWTLVSKHADVLRFVKFLIERRVTRDVEHERHRANLTQVLHESKRAFHGVKLNLPDWSPHSHSIAIAGELKNEGIVAHIIFNAYWEPLDFELPALEDGSHWRRWIDTALGAPHEICEWKAEQTILATKYRVGGRSVAVLIAGEGVNGLTNHLP